MSIVIPIEVGDTIFTGKFKNRRVTVKEIGKDVHGQPIVNGKNILKIRIANLAYKSENEGVDVSLLQKMYDTQPDTGEFYDSKESKKILKKKPDIQFDYTNLDQSPKRSSAAYAASHNPGGF